MLTVRSGTNHAQGVTDPAARAALASLIGAEPAARLLTTARLRTARTGEMLVGEGQTDRAGVLIEGMLRTVVSLPDGRAATIHYPRPVQFFGLPTVFVPVPLSVHVVREAKVIHLDGREVRRVARELPEFGWFLSRQLAGAVARVPAIIEEFGFKTVSQRVATHVMSLAEPDAANGGRTARVTHAALAEYVGSAREVVSRCLRSFASDGVIAPGHGSVRIIDEAELRRLAGQ